MNTKKPVCQLTGTDGNIFCLLGKARVALRKSGKIKELTEMTRRVQKSTSYDMALSVICEYMEAH